MSGRLATVLGLAACLAIGAVPGLSGSARAQVESREGIALQNEVLELRSELEALRAQLAGGSTLGYPYAAPRERGAPGSRELAPELLTRLTALEDQVRSLTGRVDQLANQEQRQGEQLAKQIGDLGFRVQTLEGGGTRPTVPAQHSELPAPRSPVAASPPSTLGAYPSMPPPTAYAPPPGPPPYYYAPEPGGAEALPLLPPPEPPQAAAPAAAAPRQAEAFAGALPLLPPPEPGTTPAEAAPGRSPDAVLREGRAALGRRDYPAAEAAAREVLGSGGKSQSADAQFLLAQALSGQRNYPQAAVAYDDAYRRAPTGPHAQEALLGMASALANLGTKPAACAALDKLKTEFLTQRASVRDAAASLRQRAGCQ